MSEAERAAELLEPRDYLERIILRDPEVRRYLAYGKPRWGHPEGTVEAHVAELWELIDAIARLLTPDEIRRLRLLALLHDAGKAISDWNADVPHHGVSSRRIAARFIDDAGLLEIVELHDEPYRLWKRERRSGEDVWEPLAAVFTRVRPDFDLFVLFLTIDGSSGDKDPAPRLWLHEKARRYAPQCTAWEAPARALIARHADAPVSPHRDLV